MPSHQEALHAATFREAHEGGLRVGVVGVRHPRVEVAEAPPRRQSGAPDQVGDRVPPGPAAYPRGSE